VVGAARRAAHAVVQAVARQAQKAALQPVRGCEGVVAQRAKEEATALAAAWGGCGLRCRYWAHLHTVGDDCR